jgi:hypothetical protein
MNAQLYSSRIPGVRIFSEDLMAAKKRFVYIIMTAVIITSLGRTIVIALCFNLSNVFLDDALWRAGQTIEDRRQSLATAATLMQIASSSTAIRPAANIPESTCSMIPSMVNADYYRKHKQLAEATIWLQQAAVAAPSPGIQEPIALSGWISVTTSGDVVLNWSDPAWQFRSDSQPASISTNSDGDRLTLSYENVVGRQDRVIYQWSGLLQLPYWHTLRLKARIHSGTWLTVESHSKSGLKRHLNYYQGTGDWEELDFPLTSDDLDYIYISISEPSADSTTFNYTVDFAPMTVILDKSVGTCQQ